MSGIRTHERIELNDSWGVIAAKLSDGNPRALMVCAELLKQRGRYDLASPLGILQAFLAIDSAGLFGEKLYLLFHDLCGDDLLKLLTVLRASDLGVISKERLQLELDAALLDVGGEIDHATLLSQVRNRWPQFGTEVAG